MIIDEFLKFAAEVEIGDLIINKIPFVRGGRLCHEQYLSLVLSTPEISAKCGPRDLPLGRGTRPEMIFQGIVVCDSHEGIRGRGKVTISNDGELSLIKCKRNG